MTHLSSTPQQAQSRQAQNRQAQSHRLLGHLPPFRKAGISPAAWISVGVSVGLHLGLLLLPFENDEVSTPSKLPEKQIRITQLAKQVKTIAAPKKALKPTVKPLLRRPMPSMPQPKTPSAPQTTQPQSASGAGSWDDFPLYPDAQSGCFTLSSCFQTTASLQQVADFYTRALPDKKYEFKRTLSEGDRQVFQVSRSGLSQFLSLLQTQSGSVFVLSAAPRSLDDLKTAVEVPPELITLLGDLNAQTAAPDHFLQPDLFYTRSREQGIGAGKLIPKAGIRYISLVPGQTAGKLMDDVFRANLQTNDFEITDLPQPFGGGKVYQIQKGDTRFYLNLVPTKDNASTLVVVWKDRPE
ncbi:MAG: hypothetical protein KME45_08300 [Stenomitos rutilans HA7619-LM2]|jgi:hypothetical protein|nr:hypothetical protein [Stenomitos rutilans HA7619-LM2]